MSTLTYRRFDAAERSDAEALQRLLEAAPSYSLIVQGTLPSPTAGEELLSELPPGKTADDKLVLGIFQGDELVGCADLFRGYPASEFAYIGLLLFSESDQRRGFGTEALSHIEALAASWGCRLLRIGVIETNLPALSFWRRAGFREVARKAIAGFTGEAIIMDCEVRCAVDGR